jgi:hypothetical protein
MLPRKRMIEWGCLALLAAVAGGTVAGCRPIQPPPATQVETAPAAAGEPVTEATEGDTEAATPAPGAVAAVTVGKPGDRAAVSTEDGRLVIDIYSASGIGTATVAWTAPPANPPVLRLHLGGLEELRLTSDNGEIVASVSSGTPHTISQSARSPEDAELQPLTAEQQEWLEISWAAGTAGEAAAGETAATAEMAAFPLQDGYFDIVLRDGRLAEPGTTLQIRWIDFYR